MTDKKDSRPPLESFFKTEFRKWTDEEVLDAVNYMKKKYPHIWQELVEEELAEESDDWKEMSDAKGITLSILSELYPECDLTDRGNLSREVYKILHHEIAEELSNGR